MRETLYEAFAIYSDLPTELGVATEMGENLVPRIFNTVQVESGGAISRVRTGDSTTDCTQIQLMPGMYRISGFSILTMDIPSEPPLTNPSNKYAGYCLVYDAEKPPRNQIEVGNCIAIGSVQQAFDTTPSLFDTVAVFTKPTTISVGHQCTYKTGAQNKVYIRVGTKDSLYHVFAQISIFKLG